MTEDTENANINSTHSTPSEVLQCDGQLDPNVDPPFRIVKHRGTWVSTFRIEGGKDTWLTRRAFDDRWHAEVAIEVFKTGGTDDEAFYLQLIRNFSTYKQALDAAKRPHDVANADRERIRQEKEADWAQSEKAREEKKAVRAQKKADKAQKEADKAKKEADREQSVKARVEKAIIAADNITRIRCDIAAEPKNAELRFSVAINLVRCVHGFEGINGIGSSFWTCIKSVESQDEALNRSLDSMEVDCLPLEEGIRTESLYREAALHELNTALAIGFTDLLIAAKARFLLIALDLPLLSRETHGSLKLVAAQRAQAAAALLPLRALADDIILDTARHLRRDPHDIQAISIQKAAYEFLGDQKGVGKSEQALRQARSMHAAGLRTPPPERELGASTGTRRKRDGLELEATSKQVLEKLGLEARTTQVTGDGGIDIEAYDTRPIFAGKYIIQCKDWEQPVGVTEVRELYGVMMDAGAIKGILISTGTFTKQAYEFAKGKPLELIDGEMLRGLISSLDTK